MFRRHRLNLAVSFVCALLLGYFTWYGFEGPRSFSHRDALVHQAEAVEARLAGLQAEQVRLAARVQLIRPESVDPDMLDELARRSLDYAAAGDVIVYTTDRTPAP